MIKPDTKLFYDVRHLKDFQKLSGNKDRYWCLQNNWDGNDLWICDVKTKERLFCINGDLHLGQYLCDLHNMVDRLIEEV